MQNKRNYQKELEQIIAVNQRKACSGILPTFGNESRQPGLADAPEAGAAEGTQVPSLLLHSCCAPCSSYVLEYLSQYFRITVLYFNPNIYPEEEYARRVKEQRRLIEEMGAKGRLPHPVELIEGRFEPREFYEAVRGLEQIPEGGERCFACFRLRLTEAARIAAGENRVLKEISSAPEEQFALDETFVAGKDSSAAHTGDGCVKSDAKRFDYFTTTLTISPLKNAQKLNEIGEELASQYHVNWLPCDFKKKNGYKRSVELSAEYGLYRQDYCGCVFSKQERERAKGGLNPNFAMPEKDVNSI